MAEQDNTQHIERLADRVQSPMARFLVEFDQRVAEELYHDSAGRVREACRASLEIDTQAKSIHAFAVRGQLDTVHDEEGLKQRDFDLFTQFSDLMRAGEGEAIFSQASELVAIRRSSLINQAQRYVFLQTSLEKRGKTLAELDSEELRELDDELLSSGEMNQFFPSAAHFLFGGTYFFPEAAVVRVPPGKIAELEAFEQKNTLQGEAARIINFKELCLAQMIADERINHLIRMGAARGMYLVDAVDNRFVLYKEDQEWRDVPKNYEGAQRFARPFIKRIRDVLDRGALHLTLPEYSLYEDFFTSPASDLFPRLAGIFLDNLAQNSAYQQFNDARMAYMDHRGDNYGDLYEAAITGLRQEIYEHILTLFSGVDERIHPKVEDQLKRLAVFVITGGRSSKLYSSGKGHENPYHAIGEMHQSLSELKPYLNSLAVENGLIPSHLRDR